MAQVWTKEEDDLLRELHERGFSSSEIASRMPREMTRNAVIGRRNRLKLSGKAEKRLTNTTTMLPASQVKRRHQAKPSPVKVALVPPAVLQLRERIMKTLDLEEPSSKDIDIRDPLHMDWVLNARYNPGRDTDIFNDVFFNLDPSIRSNTSPNVMGSKIVIDATLKSDPGTFSLPNQEIMDQGLALWKEVGLPEFEVCKRAKLRIAAS